MVGELGPRENRVLSQDEINERMTVNKGKGPDISSILPRKDVTVAPSTQPEPFISRLGGMMGRLLGRR